MRQLEEPDMVSFRVFTSPHGGFYLILEGSHKVFPSGYTDFAADSRRVYYQGKAMEGACPESFEVIDPLHARAGDVVYYGDVPLHGAHAETFRSLNGGYAMDKDGYYRNGKATKMNRDKKKLLEKR